MGLWDNYSNFWNNTFDEANEFTSQLKPASDVSVAAVMTSLYFNGIIFVVMLGSYEILRRFVPSVYASRKLKNYGPSSPTRQEPSGVAHLPLHNSYIPLDWVGPVFGVSWSTVRRAAGLDAYFFLRFIRMNVRITAVSTFWAAIILAPVYATGLNGVGGWYLISMTNVEIGGWRMWVPVVFIYFFSGFTFFVMKQEFCHWMELRMDFLGREVRNIDPQHHFSLIVENIPLQLRSDSALYEYFERLFPGKIHSASVILNLPTLEALEAHRLRVIKKLEKNIAIYHTTEKRPSRIIGKLKPSPFGLHMEIPTTSFFPSCRKHVGEGEFVLVEGAYPPPGTLVDLISLHTRELIDCNCKLYELQKQKIVLAGTGNVKGRKSHKWITSISDAAAKAASTIMDDSFLDNHLRSPHDSIVFNDNQVVLIQRADNMSGRYGSFSTPPSSPVNHEGRKGVHFTPLKDDSSIAGRNIPSMIFSGSSISYSGSMDSDKSAKLILSSPMTSATKRTTKHFTHPNSRSKHGNILRRMVGRLGLDFIVSGLKYINRQFDIFVANVVGTTMSSTGFVTFLDLASVTTAASTPLTHKPNVLHVHVAPEPRDIVWKSAHFPSKLLRRRERYVNVLLGVGIILWSIPLAAIQAFATADQVARIPGMEFVKTLNGGRIGNFINGYLPVVGLLSLILILPIIFEQIAIRYEHRKTVSDVQRSMLGRYFYYQLVNIFLTVTAGSLWDSLADILDHPGNILMILGNSLPKVVGYFISLLITKILAGLPIVVLRVGALGRKLFLLSIFSQAKVTQRELDGIYRRERLLYGWEYPSQLLVIVICFTYACICPIILPFGTIFFVGSLMVYKKQVLYVYTPVFESGGSMFPDASNYMLQGLICSQIILIGYTLIRGCVFEPLWLMPLPFITLWILRYFRRCFEKAALQLSLERAVERDLVSDLKTKLKMESVTDTPTSGTGVSMGFEERREKFNAKLYRQPILTASSMEPMSYRRDQYDSVTEEVKGAIRKHRSMVKETPQKRNPALIHEENRLSDESVESLRIMGIHSDLV